MTGRFLTRRIAGSLVAVLASSFVVYGAMYLAPGDPVSFLIGNRAATPELRESLRKQYNLDESFLEQYGRWLTDALSGDFGESVLHHQNVATLIAQRVPTTLLLVGMSFVLVLVFGISLGALAGRRRGVADDALTAGVSVAIATPPFVSAVVLISVFAVNLGWFPVFGAGGPWVADRMHHLVLPTVALALSWWALVAQTTRTSVRAELAKEHVQTAVGRGLPQFTAFRRHVLRNAMIPISTAGGLTLAGLIAGSAIVETAFQLDGIGGLLISSVTSRDFPVVQAVVLLLVVAFVVINTLVDVLYAALDPRVRVGGSAS